MAEVFRSLRRLAIAGGILLVMVALPAQALACGIGLGFGETIRQSQIVVIAESQGRANGMEYLTVDRVLKGRPGPIVRITVSEMPVKVRPGNRVALAVMHPQYNDGNGVSAWLIRDDGSLTQMGQSGEPRSLSAFVNYFMAPTTSTDTTALDGGTIPGGLPAGVPIVAAGLIGGCVFWRRMELRPRRSETA